MAEQRLNPAAIDDRVDFNQKRTKSGRSAAAGVHQPDSVVPAAQNVTKKSSELTGGRAVRRGTDRKP